MRTQHAQRKSAMHKTITREVLLSFWKVHILHHAAEGTIYGQWMTEELRRHAYDISPGTLYPLLQRMEKNGWLTCIRKADAATHARKEYRLTAEGKRVLALIRDQVEELYREVVMEATKHRHR